MKGVPRWTWWLVTAVPFAIFLSNVDGTWILDDHYQLASNPFIRSWEYIPKILTTRVWKSSSLEIQGPDIYRPVFLLSYMFDHFLFGLKPAGYHLINNALHCINALLLFLLAVRWLTPAAAAAGTLLFAIHPITVEAVTWIGGRMDLLAAFFALLTCHLIIRTLTLGKPSVLVSVIILTALVPLGIFSKESFTLVPFAMIFAIMITNAENEKKTRTRGWALLATAAAVSAACLIWRQHVLKTPVDAYLTTAPFRNFTELIQRFAMLFFNPSDSDFFFAYKSRSFLTQDLFPLALTVAALSAVFVAWRRNTAAVAGIFLFLAPLLPVALVVDRLGLISDRYFYLPLAGFSLAAAGILETERFRISRKVTALAVLWAVSLAATTVLRNRDWKDEVRLYSSSTERDPDNYMPYFFLAWHFYREGERDPEIRNYYETLKRKPDQLVALNNLSVRMIERRNFDEAKRLLTRARNVAPNRPKTLFNIGFLFESQGKRDQAEEWYRRALTVDPDYALAKAAIARVESAAP